MVTAKQDNLQQNQVKKCQKSAKLPNQNFHRQTTLKMQKFSYLVFKDACSWQP